MPRLKSLGWLVVHTLIALLGTAIVSTPFMKLIRPHSIFTILAKEYLIGCTCAFILGVALQHKWWTPVAKWTWCVPTIWLALRVVSVTTFVGPHVSLWSQFSGSGCSFGFRNVGCRNWFLFTIPFVRCVSYSLGSCVSLRRPAMRTREARKHILETSSESGETLLR